MSDLKMIKDIINTPCCDHPKGICWVSSHCELGVLLINNFHSLFGASAAKPEKPHKVQVDEENPSKWMIEHKFIEMFPTVKRIEPEGFFHQRKKSHFSIKSLPLQKKYQNYI